MVHCSGKAAPPSSVLSDTGGRGVPSVGWVRGEDIPRRQHLNRSQEFLGAILIDENSSSETTRMAQQQAHGQDQRGKSSRKASLDAERALFNVILKYGKQCLSQASMRTEFGIRDLSLACERLIAKGLIRPVPQQEGREDSLLSYEVSL